MSTGGRAASSASASVVSRVAEVLATVRPAIQGDGGDVELVGVDKKGVVRIRLHGACVGCPSSSETLALGIEQSLKARVAEVTSVIWV